MKKVLIEIQILINIIIVLFVPIVPGVITGGMMSNGNVCTLNIYYTIFSVFREKFSVKLADATYSFNNTILIIELIALIIINIIFFIYYKKYYLNKRNLKTK